MSEQLPQRGTDILEFDGDELLHNGRTAIRRCDVVGVHEFGPSEHFPFKYTSIDVQSGQESGPFARGPWQFSTLEPYQSVMERIYGPLPVVQKLLRYSVGKRFCMRVSGVPGMRVLPIARCNQEKGTYTFVCPFNKSYSDIELKIEVDETYLINSGEFVEHCA